MADAALAEANRGAFQVSPLPAVRAGGTVAPSAESNRDADQRRAHAEAIDLKIAAVQAEVQRSMEGEAALEQALARLKSQRKGVSVAGSSTAPTAESAAAQLRARGAAVLAAQATVDASEK